MKLTNKNLRRIILEEIAHLQEEREINDIMKKILSEESFDNSNKWNDIHHAENLRDDERDEFEHGDVAVAEDDKHHEDDLYYDAHDDKEAGHHHYNDDHDMKEVVSVDDTDDNDTGWNSMSAADTQAEEEKEAGPLNIGENTEQLSRGALYRQRYYGRY